MVVGVGPGARDIVQFVIIIIYILVMSNGTKGNDPLSDLIDPFSCLLIT